jgi:hypothetical protein
MYCLHIKPTLHLNVNQLFDHKIYFLFQVQSYTISNRVNNPSNKIHNVMNIKQLSLFELKAWPSLVSPIRESKYDKQSNLNLNFYWYFEKFVVKIIH